MKDETYYFHQTPPELCQKLIKRLPLLSDDRVLEPFRGEGSFYNCLPAYVEKYWCEIEEGRDYKDHIGEIDWVVSNPPFRLENKNGKRENSFYPLLEYYASRVNKGIAFLGNDNCFSTLTPLRMKKLNELGFYFQGYTICNVKKWRGRYFFIIFTRQKNDKINFIEGSY